jgi:putative CocE/NonD family hydrolase
MAKPRSMKKHALLAFFSLSFLAVNAQNALDSAWFQDNYTKLERMVPMRDGVKLYTAIYVPKDATEKHPFLMTRTPYSCAPYGETNFRAYWNSYQRNYLREQYILVYQDVRGRFQSEGDFMDVRPFNPDKRTTQDIDEASDTYDTIDWLLANVAGNNGRVGVFGISYPGFYASMAALSGHPALKAVSPQAPVTDWFHGDDFHHNGAFMMMDAFSFYTGFGVPRPRPVFQYKGGYDVNGSDNYRYFLEKGTLKKLAELAGDSIAFWKDLYAHPDYDEWWRVRNVREWVDSIRPAMMVVGGLFDAEDCFGAWRLYGAIEKKNPAAHVNRLVMGPWSHGQWGGAEPGLSMGRIQFGGRTAEWYQNNLEVPFFNYYLKDKGKEPTAEATVFLSGRNEWKTWDQWPPKGKTDEPVYPNADGTLRWEKPTALASKSTYVSDPAHPVPYADGIHFDRTREYMTDDQRFATRRPDVLTFRSEPLARDLVLTGTVVADLLVSISTTDADFVVKVIDEFPADFKYPSGSTYPMGGYQMLVRGEIMRGRYRNSFSKPEAFTPGKPERVRFELPDVSHAFKVGHRLVIQVQSSWFPLADRNPQQFVNIYKCGESDFKTSTINIHHDAKNPSAIILPVLEK